MKENREKAVESNMPRQSRIDISGILYHVIVRGIERRKIFRDAKDKKIFLSRMSELIEECDRYKAILCQKESCFINLVRYIRLNPLRAGIVSDVEQLDKYLWSGHSALIGKKERSWQHKDEVLHHFNRKKSRAQKQYHQFVMDGIAEGRQKVYQGGGLRRSLGGKLEKMGEVIEYWQSDDRVPGA